MVTRREMHPAFFERRCAFRLLGKEFADRLKAGPSQARILVPLVLYHHLWRGAAIDPETLNRATTQPRIGAPFTSSQAQGALCLEHWAISR